MITGLQVTISEASKNTIHIALVSLISRSIFFFLLYLPVSPSVRRNREERVLTYGKDGTSLIIGNELFNKNRIHLIFELINNYLS